MADDRFEERIKRIERILRHNFSHGYIEKKTKSVRAEPEALAETTPAIGIEAGILDALSHGERSTSEILAHVSSSEICSQATLFRYLKKMTKEGKIHRKRKGKSVFYSATPKPEKNDVKSQKKKTRKKVLL